MNKIFCIGEVLIDMVCKEKSSLKNAIAFEKKAGGAPANVACAITKMGQKAEFMGQIGEDFFGDFLSEMLKKYEIGTSLSYRKGSTTLAFVSLDEKGERDFSFFKGCDKDFELKNVDHRLIDDKDIIHFGSATALLKGNLKQSYFELFDYAKEKNIFVSFDPNYRESLITSDMEQDFVKDCIHFIKNSDFVKMSEEEIKLISKKETLDEGVYKLHLLGAKIVAVTLGKDGTLLSFENRSEIIPSININQLDSTGAGDAFVGGMLSFILKEIQKEKALTFEKLKEICIFSNKIGAITCTNYGAMDSIPTKEQVDAYK